MMIYSRLVLVLVGGIYLVNAAALNATGQNDDNFSQQRATNIKGFLDKLISLKLEELYGIVRRNSHPPISQESLPVSQDVPRENQTVIAISEVHPTDTKQKEQIARLAMSLMETANNWWSLRDVMESFHGLGLTEFMVEAGQKWFCQWRQLDPNPSSHPVTDEGFARRDEFMKLASYMIRKFDHFQLAELRDMAIEQLVLALSSDFNPCLGPEYLLHQYHGLKLKALNERFTRKLFNSLVARYERKNENYYLVPLFGCCELMLKFEMRSLAEEAFRQILEIANDLDTMKWIYNLYRKIYGADSDIPADMLGKCQKIGPQVLTTDPSHYKLIQLAKMYQAAGLEEEAKRVIHKSVTVAETALQFLETAKVFHSFNNMGFFSREAARQCLREPKKYNAEGESHAEVIVKLGERDIARRLLQHYLETNDYKDFKKSTSLITLLSRLGHKDLARQALQRWWRIDVAGGLSSYDTHIFEKAIETAYLAKDLDLRELAVTAVTRSTELAQANYAYVQATLVCHLMDLNGLRDQMALKSLQSIRRDIFSLKRVTEVFKKMGLDVRLLISQYYAEVEASALNTRSIIDQYRDIAFIARYLDCQEYAERATQKCYDLANDFITWGSAVEACYLMGWKSKTHSAGVERLRFAITREELELAEKVFDKFHLDDLKQIALARRFGINQ